MKNKLPKASTSLKLVVSIFYLFLYLIFLILGIISGVLSGSNALFITFVIFDILFIILYIILMVILSKTYLPLKQIYRIISNLKKYEYYHERDYSDYFEFQELYTSLYELSNELEILNDKLNKKELMLKDIDIEKEREQKLQKDLVYSVSHELKTPLAIIEASSQAILDEIYKGEDAKKQMALILSECESSKKMLKDILNIYKMNNNEFHLNKTTFNLKDLVLDKLNELNDYRLKYEMNIIKSLDDATISADIEEIKKVLSNVLMNAFTYSPKGSYIYINIHDLGNETIFELINENASIEEEKLKHIFEPFTKLDPSHEKKKDHGNGLGLYIVKEILNKHKANFGIINLDNAVKFYMIFDKNEGAK